MLIIKIGKIEKIDRALKRFKRKFRNTKVMELLRKKKQYIKPSEKKRLNKQKAIYNNKKRDSYEQ
jgi:small subunit ribosomal protein S21